MQVILKQQRLIKRLLKKCHGGDFSTGASGASDVSANSTTMAPSTITTSSTTAAMTTTVEAAEVAISAVSTANVLITKNDPDDSDSAIIMDDHLTEVRLLS